MGAGISEFFLIESKFIFFFGGEGGGVEGTWLEYVIFFTKNPNLDFFFFFFFLFFFLGGGGRGRTDGRTGPNQFAPLTSSTSKQRWSNVTGISERWVNVVHIWRAHSANTCI